MTLSGGKRHVTERSYDKGRAERLPPNTEAPADVSTVQATVGDGRRTSSLRDVATDRGGLKRRGDHQRLRRAVSADSSAARYSLGFLSRALVSPRGS
jgi:hypothetical protein